MYTIFNIINDYERGLLWKPYVKHISDHGTNDLKPQELVLGGKSYAFKNWHCNFSVYCEKIYIYGYLNVSISFSFIQISENSIPDLISISSSGIIIPYSYRTMKPDCRTCDDCNIICIV